MGPGRRIGVYVCHCGTNIASNVDVAQVTEYAESQPGVVVGRDYLYMCSDPGQALIQNDISQHGLEAVVVAACSPRMHEPTFREAARQAGLNPYLTVMANIREQCAWVHDDRQLATDKALRLVASAVARAELLEPLEAREVEVTPAVLVIGGGVAGLVASLDVADAGYRVHLVEQADHLGGHVGELDTTYPTLEPVEPRLAELIARIQEHSNATVHLRSGVAAVDGFVGNFTVTIEAQDGETCTTVQVGSIIVATGFDAFDPHRKPELAYGRYPHIVTTLELEDRLAAGSLGTNGARPAHIAFVQCVGSRDVQVGNPYCSRACCMVVAKQARQVRNMLPHSDVTVFYMDVRTFGKGAEEFYDEARAQGVLYRRGCVSEIAMRKDRVVLMVEDTLLGRAIDDEADLIVLATGMEARADTADLSALLKLPRSPDGFFLELHPKLRPVDTSVAGVYLAGCCQGPKGIADTVAHARAAASSALIPILRGTEAAESATAAVDAGLCAGCGMCVDECPFGAPALDPLWGISRINAVLCKGCGACAVSCPSSAISLRHFTSRQMLAQVDALVA